MARRKIPPCPVEALIDEPGAIKLPAAAFGMLARLVLHFWQTECAPLPKGDEELFSIVRAHRPTWRHWKAELMRVFEVIRPELEHHRLNVDKRLASFARLQEKARRGMAVAKERRAAATLDISHPAFHAPKVRQEVKAARVKKREASGGTFVD